MNSIRDEENENLRINNDYPDVSQESTNSISGGQSRSPEGNIHEEPNRAVERQQQAVVETQLFVQEEEGENQNYLKSIICSKRFKIGLLILFILLISALVLLFFLYARHGADIGEAKNNASVMLLGGWHDDITNSTTIYNSIEKSWKNCRLTLPTTLSIHGAALIDNEIYIFGGRANGTTQERLKSLYKLGAGNKWERMADMNEKRGSISQSSVVFNSEIWVIGGSAETKVLKSVEKYNPKTKKWTEMSELNEPRSSAAATVVDGKIYVSGGWDGWKTKNSVEVYDPEKGKWEIFTPSMPHAVGSHILIGNNSHLIAIGGDLSMNEPTNQVWKMDVLDPKREWKKMPYLQQKRRKASAVIIADELMVFGGSTISTNRIDSVEIFDGVEWKIRAPLAEERNAFAYIPLTYAQERLFLKQFC